MPLVLRYFWFFGAGIMLINIIIWRRRLLVVVENDRATPAELRQFTTWACIGLVAGPILLGFVSIIADWSSPFCAGIMQFTDVASSLVSLITLAGWLGLLWWVWRGNGADFLARVAPALGQRPRYDKSYSPSVVRFAVTLMIVVSSVGSILAWRSMPVVPDMSCPIRGVSNVRSGA